MGLESSESVKLFQAMFVNNIDLGLAVVDQVESTQVLFNTHFCRFGRLYWVKGTSDLWTLIC